MSTMFVWEGTKDAFVAAAKERGWTEGKSDGGNFALVSPNGHYAHYISDWQLPDGRTVTGFDRYGGNHDVCGLAEELGAVSEHDPKFEQFVETDDD